MTFSIHFIQCIYLISIFSGKSTASGKFEAPIYDEPDNFRHNTANTGDMCIELKECPAYKKLHKDARIELEKCPAYGELPSS